MAAKRLPSLEGTVFAVEIDLSNGVTESYGPYPSAKGARAQRTFWIGERADQFMGKPVHHPHVVDSRVFVAAKWEEI